MVVLKILNFFSDLDHFNAFWWAGWVGVCSLLGLYITF